MSHHGSYANTNTVQSPTRLTALVPIWDSGEQTLLLNHDRTFRAGRGSTCDLIIAHPGVAEWHATVIRNGGEVTVRPEHGQHVWVNDKLVDQVATVQVGDTLAFGPATFRIEARRAVRRTAPSRTGNGTENLPELAARLEQQLNDLQNQYRRGMLDADAATAPSHQPLNRVARPFSNEYAANQHAPAAPTPAGPATAFMELAATTNRRTVLDQRETQLNEWHQSLDRRREELDQRSANLTQQQAALSVRQTELDRRTAELESWHQVALDDVEDRKNSLKAEAEADLYQQRQDLQNQEQELIEEQQRLAEQLTRMEDSRQSIADQLQSLEDARQSLKDERTELAEERNRFDSDTEARHQADSEQKEAFQQQQQKLDTFAKQLEDEREALQQQQADLRTQHEQLEIHNVEVADAEERIQSAASYQPTGAADTAPHGNYETEAALLLLEEQKSNLAQQQTSIQQQLNAIQRKEGELELLRADVEAQRNLLSDAQVNLEFEKQEAAAALEEARRINQDTLAAQPDADAESPAMVSADPTVSETDHAALAAREAELATRTLELASRLAELKSWKKQLESREQSSVQQQPFAETAPDSESDKPPKSVLASQLSSLMMPSGVIPNNDSLQNSPADDELATAQQQNIDLQSETAELRSRVSELELQLQAAEQESTSLSSLLTNVDPNVSGRALTEQNLLAELQALKSELSDSATPVPNANTDGQQVVVQSQIAELEARNQTLIDAHQQEVSKHEETIEELNHQLELVQQQFEGLEQRAMQAVAASETGATDSDADAPVVTAANDETVAKLSQMVEQLSEKLEQRNNTIDNLQTQLNGGIPLDSAASMSPQEAQVLSQELDSRTVLLDEREAAIRERERLQEQSEQELKAQRIAIQEARQKLELARAEIHSAREPAASESMLLSRDLIDSVTELAEAGATKEKSQVFNESAAAEDQAAEEEEDDNQRSSVRSEIAELFGLGSKSKAEKPVEEPTRAPSTAAELMEAVDDYSQESAAAVSLSFESAQDILIAADPEPTNNQTFSEEEPKEEPKSEADDVVASYMEQLLSRSRAAADGESPEELKQKRPKDTVIKKKEPKKKAPGQASFIDQYMSGQYGSEDESALVAEPGPSDDSPAEDQLAKDESAELRRSKIDRNAQRLDLQSFRELSTQSAANALATHARRQQKGGITTRTTIVTTLGLITVFVLAAAVIGVIPFGWLTTLCIVGVAVSGAELAWKLKKIQNEVNERTRMALMSAGIKKQAPIPGVAEPHNPTAANQETEPNISVANSETATCETSVETTEVSQNTTHQSNESTDLTPNSSVNNDEVKAVAPSNSEHASLDTPDAVAKPAADMTSECPAQQNLEASPKDEGSSISDSTRDLLESLTPKTSTPDLKAGMEANSITEGADSVAESTAEKQDDGGVPDAFDEAFRMLTSGPLPIKKADSEDPQPNTTAE